MPQQILESDWSDYDDRKKKKGDANFFACTEDWEVDYLLKKIRRIYPQYREADILLAIQTCCKTIPAPRPRVTFVQCVIQTLLIIKYK